MKKIISRKLYVEGLKKIKVSGMAFTIILVLLNSILPIVGLMDRSYSGYYNGSTPVVTYQLMAPFCALVLVLVPIIAHDMFAFLNERNQSDFYHSIPQKRTCVYISFTAAVLTWAFGTVILSSIINGALWLLAGYSFSFYTFIGAMLPYLVVSVMMSGVMILAMTLTGTKISNFLIAILIFLFFRVMGTLFAFAVEELVHVIDVGSSAFKYITFDFFLPYSIIDSGVFGNNINAFTNSGLLIYSLGVGIFGLVLGGVAFNIRRSESAAKSAPNKLLQHIYRSAVTLPFVFVIAVLMIIDGEFEAYHLVFAILALLVYVVYELITTKKIKNIVKTLPMIIIPVFSTLLLVLGVFTCRFAINNDTFTVEEFAGYRFADIYGSSYESDMLEKTYVDNDEAAEILSKALHDNIKNRDKLWEKEHLTYSKFKIKLNSGRVISRNLYLSGEDVQKLQDILYRDSDYLAYYTMIPKPSEVESVDTKYFDDDAFELYKMYYQEYCALSVQDRLRVKRGESRGAEIATIHVSGNKNNVGYWGNYPVFYASMPRTAEMILDKIIQDDGYMYDKKSLSETYERIDKIINDISKYNISYAHVNIYFDSVTNSDPIFGQSITGADPLKSLKLVNDVLDIILSDEQAFNYTDYNDVYRFELFIDTLTYLNEEQIKHEMDLEIMEALNNKNIHYVKISKENMEKITSVIKDFNS